ncbi:MAG: hypothetical protein JWN76_1118 [Chitinophagaceae bacterium]|nr:hypothetical protein [Chitinophagaceae bacterium]
MILKNDKVQLGLILGFIAPFFGVIFFYFWKFRPLTFFEFLQYLGIQKALISSMISVSLLANAILFTIYINTRRDHTAKGIFIATCVYAIAGLLFKLIY